MTDHELLALAAKAYGAKMSDYSDRTPDHWIAERVQGSRSWYAWDPLTDDGDALRLAGSLRLLIEFGGNGGNEIVLAQWNRGAADSIYCYEVFSDYEAPNIAMRRAIVRTAAEIGRAA